jgi:hypothetical protein
VQFSQNDVKLPWGERPGESGELARDYAVSPRVMVRSADALQLADKRPSADRGAPRRLYALGPPARREDQLPSDALIPAVRGTFQILVYRGVAAPGRQ